MLKYMACKLLTDTAIKTISNNYPCQVVLEQRAAPPLNRLAVTIKVLRHYIFAMLFAVLKYMACKLLTATAIKTISNNYPCQVVLEQRAAAPLNRLEVTIKVLRHYIFAKSLHVFK